MIETPVIVGHDDGEEITVVTDGEDEQRAAEGIKTFFAKGRK